MRDFKESLKEIYLKHKGMLSLMAVLLVAALALLIFSLVNLRTSTSVVKTGYSDIGRYQGGDWNSMANSGGYRDGVWGAMTTFPIFALVLGVLHNLIAVKLFRRKGAGLSIVFLVVSIVLTLGAFIVLNRLLAEG